MNPPITHSMPSVAQDESDLAMVLRARSGDRAAFASLWLRHARRFRAILAAMLPRAQVDDALQDVALSALAALPTLRNEHGFVAWVSAIARNHARNAQVAARRRPVPVPLEQVESGADAVLPELEAREILAAIDALPATYRCPLRLRFLRGLDGPEIARRLRMTQGSVRVTLCRGLKLLRQRLAATAEGPQ